MRHHAYTQLRLSTKSRALFHLHLTLEDSTTPYLVAYTYGYLDSPEIGGCVFSTAHSPAANQLRTLPLPPFPGYYSYTYTAFARSPSPFVRSPEAHTNTWNDRTVLSVKNRMTACRTAYKKVCLHTNALLYRAERPTSQRYLGSQLQDTPISLAVASPFSSLAVASQLLYPTVAYPFSSLAVGRVCAALDKGLCKTPLSAALPPCHRKSANPASCSVITRLLPTLNSSSEVYTSKIGHLTQRLACTVDVAAMTMVATQHIVIT
nr:hypothetical protein HmN_000969100 [Hymenolepis microstoma]